MSIPRRSSARPSPCPPSSVGSMPSNLATALLWKTATREDLTMATHDVALATAAEAYGLQVVGA